MQSVISSANWSIPFKRDHLLLKDALADMKSVGAADNEIPLIVRMVENPKLSLPGIDIFHGAVALHHHDIIHLILGRGMQEMDEAFTIGFTMGSTKNVTTSEEKLYVWIAANLYPDNYKFSPDAIKVFKDAVRLGGISRCHPLDNFDFSGCYNLDLKTIRGKLGLEENLILTYYALERQRYPNSEASQRLLDN